MFKVSHISFLGWFFSQKANMQHQDRGMKLERRGHGMWEEWDPTQDRGQRLSCRARKADWQITGVSSLDGKFRRQLLYGIIYMWNIKKAKLINTESSVGGGGDFPPPFKVLSAGLIIKLTRGRLTRENSPLELHTYILEPHKQERIRGPTYTRSSETER